MAENSLRVIEFFAEPRGEAREYGSVRGVDELRRESSDLRVSQHILDTGKGEYYSV